MNNRLKGKKLCLALVMSFFIAGSAQAAYRLSAFSGSIAYDSIMNGEVESAVDAFRGVDVSSLDFYDLTNLCVTQMMERDVGRAIATCKSALEDLESSSPLGADINRMAAAVIYSNLGVAKALSGNLRAASKDLLMAREFNPGHENTRENLATVNRYENAATASD